MTDQEGHETETPPEGHATSVSKTDWDLASEKIAALAKYSRERAKELSEGYLAVLGNPEAARLAALADELDKLRLSTEVDLAKQDVQLRRDNWLKQRQHQRDWVIENTRQTVQLGLSAIRTTVLINGGALVALLAFLGNVWARSGPVAAFSGAFQWFAAGLLIATITLAFSYAAQFCYGLSDENGDAIPVWQKVGKAFHATALLLFAAALAAFAGGCFSSFAALNTADPPRIAAPAQETANGRPQAPVPATEDAVPAAKVTDTNSANESTIQQKGHGNSAAPSVASKGPAASVSPPAKEVTPKPPAQQ